MLSATQLKLKRGSSSRGLPKSATVTCHQAIRDVFDIQIAGDPPPDRWDEWLPTMFPRHFSADFADRHRELWDWGEAIQPSYGPAPFIAVWGRGGAKSTNAEALSVRVGSRQVRWYVWYVCETQDQADKHVANIATMMESAEIEHYHPELSQPLKGRNGNQRGWSRAILRASTGFTVEAIGLNKATRGGKMDWARPDLIIFDDIDNRDDSPKTIEKKIGIITHSILPAGANHVAVLFVQNLIHSRSIASMLVDRSATGADFLGDRIVSGPYPAVEGLKYEAVQDDDEAGKIRYVITAGEATWAGQPIEVCQAQLNLWGPRAFKTEAQHEVSKDKAGALWDRNLLAATRVASFPALHRIIIGVDPHASSGQTGIIAVGAAKIGQETHLYVLADGTPEEGVKPGVWGLAVVAAYNLWEADVIVGEVNNGGDMVEQTIKTVKGGENVNFQSVRASRGKQTRAEPISAKYSEGKIHHVGFFPALEDELCSWVPGDSDSPNRLDALVWACTKLLGLGGKGQADVW